MSSLSITSSRLQQVEEVLETFVFTFAHPLDSAAATEKILSIYHPDVEWFDHAFLVRRKRHQAILGLHKSFNHCNQPFNPEIKAIHPTAKGAILEQVWRGCCANDMVRPNGQVVVKAHGREFACHVCMVIEVDETRKLKKIDKHYNRVWEDGIPQSEYAVLQGASMKDPSTPASL